MSTIDPRIPALAAQGYLRSLQDTAPAQSRQPTLPTLTQALAQDPNILLARRQQEEALARERTAEAVAAEMATQAKKWDTLGRFLQTIGGPDDYAMTVAAIERVEPGFAQLLGLDPDQYDPVALQEAGNFLLTAKEYADERAKATQLYFGKEPLYGFMRNLTAVSDEATDEEKAMHWNDVVQFAQPFVDPRLWQQFREYTPGRMALARRLKAEGDQATATTDKSPTAGSFEEYVGLDPETQAKRRQQRKEWLQADDKPRVTVNMGEGFGPPQVKFGTGEEALEGLDEKEQRIVKLMASYKYIKPTGFSLRVKYWRDLVERAAAYDATFDFAQYDSRQRLRTDFAVGKAAQNVRSLNTAIGHLGTLRDKARALQNSPLELWNKIKNTALSQVGDPRVVDFNVAANAVAGELATLFKNTSGTDQEIRAWREQVASSQSPAQLSAAINTSVELLVSRLNVLKEQYEKGMGRPVDIELLHPKSRQTLSKMGWNVSALEPGSAATSAPKKKFTIVEVQ